MEGNIHLHSFVLPIFKCLGGDCKEFHLRIAIALFVRFGTWEDKLVYDLIGDVTIQILMQLFMLLIVQTGDHLLTFI